MSKLPEFNPNSNDHLSALLFGGKLKVTEKVPVIDAEGNIQIIKSGINKGNIKVRNQETLKQLTGLKLNPLEEWKLKKEGFFKTDESVLSLISKGKGDGAEIAKLILELRGFNKQISTYYESTKEYIEDDSCVHPNFNMCATDTGRLSCNKPNVQNQPNNSVLDHFTSRFNGKIISVDLSQIEVCVFAHLCGDRTLINLLQEGQDIHRYIASNVYGKPEDEITTEERKAVKPGTFGIIYGNGALKLSQTTGQTIEWCKNFIETFYDLFPRSREWHNELIKSVEATGRIKTFTGRTLKFKKFPAKFDWQIKKGIVESYNPPDIKNWPVQSIAGDIYKLLLGNLFRKYLKRTGKYLLINTIHDSIMFDCPDDEVTECVSLITEVLDKAVKIVYNTYNTEFKVPIKYEISIGNTWGEL